MRSVARMTRNKPALLRSPAHLATIATFLFVLALLVVVFAHGEATSIDGGVTTETGGRLALVGIILAGVLTAFVTRLDVAVPSWVGTVTGLLSFALLLMLWLLVVLDFDSLAWTAYGGLQVLRARTNFADLDWVARALECGGCEEWPQLHGPLLELLNIATGGLFQTAWVAPLDPCCSAFF